MVELFEIGSPDDFRGYYNLSVSGRILENVHVSDEGEKDIIQLSIGTDNVEEYEILSEMSLNDFPEEVLDIRFLRIIALDSFLMSILLYRNENSSAISSFELCFDLHVNLTDWTSPYGFLPYKILFKSQLDEINIPGLIIESEGGQAISKNPADEHIFEIITLKFIGISPLNKKLKQIISEKLHFIIDLHHETTKMLIQNDEDSIFVSFLFPEELKAPCKQYLDYFAKFLQDLGIKANSNLNDEAGKVLFSVTPTDDKEALDKIREALAVYLNLPSSPIVYDESFAAMRLQQQVENLQHSQKMTEREIRSSERELRLSQTVIEHQDKIIQQKDTTIEQQNRIIEKITSKSIMMDSLENKEELVKVFEGLEVGHSKWLFELTGIKANSAKIIDTAVKSTFGKDREIISLKIND
jgi:hypothetical protein